MAAAEIAHGTPLNLDLGGAYIDLGAERRDGQHVIVMAVDDGAEFVNLDLTAEAAEVLADALRALAAVQLEGRP